MKSLKKLLSIILVASMIFTSNAVATFAESVNEVETTSRGERLSEPVLEEESIEANADVEEEEEEETSKGEILSEPELEEEEESIEANVDEGEEEETEETELNVEEEESTESKADEVEEEEESKESNADVVVDDLATASEAEEIFDENIATNSEVEEIEIEIFPNKKQDDMLYGRIPGDTWGDDHWDSTAKRANVAYANNQDEVHGGELLRLWTFTASGMDESTGEAQDFLEGVAPMGKKFWGVYEMGSSYDSRDAFVNDYDHTKNWDEALFNTYGNPYTVSGLYYYYKNQAGWDATPKFYGAVYDDALTIKYFENLPSHEWDLDDESRWSNYLTRWDLYHFIGSVTPESREYCYRGGYLKRDEGTAITASKWGTSDKLTLVGWNTAEDGSGTFYELGEFIPDESPFTNHHLSLYAVWQDSSLVKRVKYDSNVDMMSGYTDPYFDDAVTGDTTNNPIVLVGNGIKSIKWDEFKEKSLTKWNTAADGSGTDYAVGATITDYSGFDADGVLQLYAIWSEPVDIKFGINYEQNIPTGWTLQGTWDISNISDSSLPITLANGNGLSIKNDTTGDVRYLRAWIQESVSRQWRLGLEITADGWDKGELFRYGQETTPTLKALWQEVYAVAYQQNLGDYTLDGDWFNASMTENLEWDPITVSGSMDYDKMKIGRKDNNIKFLIGWNTNADGTGTSIAFGETIDNTKASLFDTHKELKLYAQWEETEDAYYYTDGKPRIVLAYLDKDATTSTKEKIQVFDLSDTSITVDSINEIVTNAKPTWATIEKPGGENRYYDAIGWKVIKQSRIYGAEDVYRSFRPDTTTVNTLGEIYEYTKEYSATTFARVGYQVPQFYLIGRKGTGNQNSISQAPVLFGESEDLSAYLDGQAYDPDDTTESLNTIDTSYTGIFTFEESEIGKYMVDDYYKSGGLADTTAATIVGKDGIMSAFEDWSANISSPSDKVFYAFSYMLIPFMFWYVDGDTIHFSPTNVAGSTPIARDDDGLVYTSLSKDNIKHAVIDDAIVVDEAKSFFSGFTALEDITGLEKLDTSKVKNMSNMFKNCQSLRVIPFNDSFVTSNVTDMTSMFEGCSAQYLNLTSFDTAKVTNTDNMFKNCENLQTIYASDNFDLTNVTSGTDMFDGCINLKGGEDTRCADMPTPLDQRYAKQDNGESDVGFFSLTPTKANWMYWYLTDDGATIHYTNVSTGHTAIQLDQKGKIFYDGLAMSGGTRHKITTAVFDTNITGATNASYMFYDFGKMTEIQDLSNFNTSNVTDMKWMFASCELLTPLNGLTTFNTSKVTDMNHMFYNTQITELDLTNFNTTNVTDMQYMFYHNTELANITFGTNFKTSNVTNMEFMFAECEKLTSLNVTGFDTSKVTEMRDMFQGCKLITNLDLTSFDTHLVSHMQAMFADCTALETINVSEDFYVDLAGEGGSDGMFSNCTSIVGCMGTTYDSSKTDREYAHIDGGPSNPGYFSGAPAPRSTLNPDGKARFYIVDFDGSNKNIYSITKTDGQSALENILSSLKTPDPTSSEEGFCMILSSSKDSAGHRVFLSNDDLKDGYDESTVFDDGDDWTKDELLDEYTTFAALTDTYDLYFGTCYTPFINEIKGIIGGTALPKVDELVYVPVGYEYDLTGTSFTFVYTDGSEEDKPFSELDPNDVTVTPTTFSKGDTQLVVSYKGVEYVVADNVFVYEDGIDAYDIYDMPSKPTKLVYVEGETFDPRGMVIRVHIFSDVTGDLIEVKYDRKETEFTYPKTPLTIGDSPITIQYGGYDGCTYDIDIEIVRKGLSVSVDTNSNKNYYNDGDELTEDNLNGLSVTVNYDTDPTTVTYTYPDDKDYFTFDPSMGEILSPGDNNLNITIAGVKVEYPIVVLPDGGPSQSTKSKDPDKTQYEVGDKFNPAGLKLNVTYPNGITKTIEYNEETKNEFAFEPELDQELTTTNTDIKVSFRGSPQTSFPITVRKKPQAITIVNNPTTIIYSDGDKFDPTGLVVQVTYDDGTTEDIPYDSTTASGFTFTPALDQAFDDGNIGQIVEVTFGSFIPGIMINMDPIYPKSFSFIEYDPNTNSVYITPNPDTQTDPDSVRAIFEEMLNEAIKNGATGFHEYNANGVNDAKNKYDKYTPATMTKEEALARFDEYVNAGATGNLFIGPSFKNPNPKPSPTPTPNPNTYNDGGSSDGGGSSTSGPTVVTNNNLAQTQLNTYNSLPQNSLLNDTNLYLSLSIYQENLFMPKTNVLDINGNKGFGQWKRVPGKPQWYFLTGDLNANGTKGSVGFLKNGWFKLSWEGQENWYHFGADAKMTLGWYKEGDKVYFLQNDLTDKYYGRALTGTQSIGGRFFNFNSNGELDDIRILINAMGNVSDALDLSFANGALSNYEPINLYKGEIIAPNMIAPKSSLTTGR